MRKCIEHDFVSGNRAAIGRHVPRGAGVFRVGVVRDGGRVMARGMRLSASAARAMGFDPAPKKNKFGARKKEVDGVTFDSTKEAKRYQALKLMEQAGQIRDLRTQVEYLLIPKQKKPAGGLERAASYSADFVYLDSDGNQVVEDVKSEPTRKKADYILRRKLMLMVHGIEIREI